MQAGQELGIAPKIIVSTQATAYLAAITTEPAHRRGQQVHDAAVVDLGAEHAGADDQRGQRQHHGEPEDAEDLRRPRRRAPGGPVFSATVTRTRTSGGSANRSARLRPIVARSVMPATTRSCSPDMVAAFSPVVMAVRSSPGRRRRSPATRRRAAPRAAGCPWSRLSTAISLAERAEVGGPHLQPAPGQLHPGHGRAADQRRAEPRGRRTCAPGTRAAGSSSAAGSRGSRRTRPAGPPTITWMVPDSRSTSSRMCELNRIVRPCVAEPVAAGPSCAAAAAGPCR